MNMVLVSDKEMMEVDGGAGMTVITAIIAADRVTNWLTGTSPIRQVVVAVEGIVRELQQSKVRGWGM